MIVMSLVAVVEFTTEVLAVDTGSVVKVIRVAPAIPHLKLGAVVLVVLVAVVMRAVRRVKLWM